MGYVHVYHGEGKGKTTAAMGLALRALGNDMPVVIVQFLKGRPSGEIRMLEGMANVQVFRGKAGEGFTFDMTPAERAQTLDIHRANLAKAHALTAQAGLLVLDEALGAIETGLLPLEDVLAFLADAPEPLEIVLTGRTLPDALRERADYITEMRAVRHPYTTAGIGARKGIEF